MKKIYVSFAMTYAIASLLIFALISVATWRSGTRSVEAALEQILNQVEMLHTQQVENRDATMDIIQEDYIGRTRSIAYILENDTMSRTTENLRKVAQMMDVENINVLDANGVVVLSTLSGAEGVSLDGHVGADLLMSLIRGETAQGTIVALGRTDESGERVNDYVAVRIDHKDYTALEITFHSDEVDTALRQADIRYVLDNFMTEYRTTVAAFSPEGELVGMTTNNPQLLQIADATTPRQVVELLQRARENTFLEVNNSPSCILARPCGDFILCACYDVSNIASSLGMMRMGMAVMIVVMMAVVLGLLWNFFQRYLVKDLHRMEEDIGTFLAGDVKREIRPCANPEMAPLRDAIAALRESYRNRSKRLSKIVGGVSTNMAVFECLSYTNSVYYSDNLRQVLGMDEEAFARVTASLPVFQRFMEGLVQRMDGDSAFAYNGRWLVVKAFQQENEFYGILEDKTAEYREKAMELDRAYQDAATGLYGRAWFDRRLRELLAHPETACGVLLMFDMDNFKAVNDAFGHPEGDKALAVMADCLRHAFRQDDIIGRVGGDEFAVYMPNPMTHDALAEKLGGVLASARRAFAKHKWPGVSASIGAAFGGEGRREYAALYESADTALYIAKALGKNRYYINDEGIRCMRKDCVHCREECSRRRALGLK